jgi:hypothetical protein
LVFALVCKIQGAYLAHSEPQIEQVGSVSTVGVLSNCHTYVFVYTDVLPRNMNVLSMHWASDFDNYC